MIRTSNNVLPGRAAPLLRSLKSGTTRLLLLSLIALSAAAAGAPDEIDTIGTAPPVDTARTAIRDTEVSVRARNVSLSIGLSYVRNSRTENLRQVRTRALSLPVELSIGLTDRVELFFNTALESGERQTVLLEDSQTDVDRSVADLVTGMSWQIARESVAWPSITLNGSVAVPIDSTDENEALDDDTGDGSASVGVSVTRRLDPLFLSANIAYGNSFSPSQIGDSRVRDGGSIAYGFGTTFQVNSAVSISGQFNARYQFETSVNGDNIEGSNQEPMSLVTSLAYSPGPRQVWQYSLKRGLNDDDTGISFGLTSITTFGKQP